MAKIRGKHVRPSCSHELASSGASASVAVMPDDHELWKPVGRLGTFEVSTFGRVRFANSGKHKSLTLARSGFMVVNLYANGISNVRNVHSLVAEAFLGPLPAGWMVVQLDTNRVNNHLDNLAFRPLGERRPATPSAGWETNQRLDLAQAKEIFRRANSGAATIDLAEKFGISAPMVSDIKFGRKWRLAGLGAASQDA